jgi:hypothetical protein
MNRWPTVPIPLATNQIKGEGGERREREEMRSLPVAPRIPTLISFWVGDIVIEYIVMEGFKNLSESKLGSKG